MFELLQVVAAGLHLAVAAPAAAGAATAPPRSDSARLAGGAPRREMRDAHEIVIVTAPAIHATAVFCTDPAPLAGAAPDLAAAAAAALADPRCRKLGNVPYAFVEERAGIAEISPIEGGEWGNIPIGYTLAAMLRPAAP